jgi:hypothetical protein
VAGIFLEIFLGNFECQGISLLAEWLNMNVPVPILP